MPQLVIARQWGLARICDLNTKTRRFVTSRSLVSRRRRALTRTTAPRFARAATCDAFWSPARWVRSARSLLRRCAPDVARTASSHLICGSRRRRFRTQPRQILEPDPTLRHRHGLCRTLPGASIWAASIMCPTPRGSIAASFFPRARSARSARRRRVMTRRRRRFLRLLPSTVGLDKSDRTVRAISHAWLHQDAPKAP
jgi:hypothetical protein